MHAAHSFANQVSPTVCPVANIFYPENISFKLSQSAAASGWEILTVKGVYQSKLAAPATVLYNVVLRGEYQKDI